MTKTPEQMAEEYANSTDSCDGDQEYIFAYKGFLAGYKAGQEHPFQFQTKMWVDPIGRQDRWISVKERLPEESTHCVIRIDDGEYQVAWREDGHWIMFNPCCIYNSQLNNVTHWMPLTELPKEEK